MQTISEQLKNVIGNRLKHASSKEILWITSAICAGEMSESSHIVVNDVSPEPQGREIVNDVVIDHDTGLMWSRDSLPGGKMPWQSAVQACEELDLGGYSDWRLPTIKELLTLVDYDRHDPAIDTEVFKRESAWYWTSTPYAPSPGDCAWSVDFGDGGAGGVDHDYDGFVRAVRAGQSSAYWHFRKEKNVQTISEQLKNVIGNRLKHASSKEILWITSAICAGEMSESSHIVVNDVSPEPQGREIVNDVVIDHDTGLSRGKQTRGTGPASSARAWQLI